jgi:HD-like signal output (HDOD) protein
MSSAVTPDVAWEGVLSKVRTFPTLPMIMHKITELVNIPETSAKDIEVVIAKDHDIGKLVHEEYGDSFRQACSLALRNNILLRQAEQEVLHFTHDQTGGPLLAQWNLPPKIVALVRYHHEPTHPGEYQREAGVIHLADILCRAKGLGSGGDNKIPLIDHATWNSLGLTFGDLEQVLQRISENFEEAAEFLDS